MTFAESGISLSLCFFPCIHQVIYIFVIYPKFIIDNRYQHLFSDPTGSVSLFPFLLPHLVWPLPFTSSSSGNSCWSKDLFLVKTAAFQILSSTGSVFCSSTIVSKSTTSSSLETKILCSMRLPNDSFPHVWHWPAIYSAQLLEKKTWQVHYKCLHSMDMQSHFSNFSFVHYTMLLLCSSSVFEFNAIPKFLPFVIPSPLVYPWFPFLFYYLVSLWFLLIPFKLADWYFAAASALTVCNCLANILRHTDSVPFLNAAVTQSLISTLQPGSACFLLTISYPLCPS